MCANAGDVGAHPRQRRTNLSCRHVTGRWTCHLAILVRHCTRVDALISGTPSSGHKQKPIKQVGRSHLAYIYRRLRGARRPNENAVKHEIARRDGVQMEEGLTGV